MKDFQPGRLGDLVLLYHGKAGWTVDPAVRLTGVAPGQDAMRRWTSEICRSFLV